MVTPMLLAMWRGLPRVVELWLESSENTLRSPGLYGLVENFINEGHRLTTRWGDVQEQVARETLQMLKLRIENTLDSEYLNSVGRQPDVTEIKRIIEEWHDAVDQ
jgi:hypothetical protein